MVSQKAAKGSGGCAARAHLQAGAGVLHAAPMTERRMTCINTPPGAAQHTCSELS